MSGAQGTGRLAACAAGLRQPNLRPVLLSSLVHALTENAIWMGVLVYAFQSGGAGEMGVVSFALLMPAVVVAPVASMFGDRYHRVKVLAGSLVAVGVSSAAVAIAVMVGAAAIVVYVLAAIANALVTLPRPAVGALSPSIVETSEQLVAFNVGRSMMQGAGRTLGPAVAGIVLAVAPLHVVFWASAVLSVAVGVLVLRVRLLPTAADEEEPISFGAIHRETVAGLSLLRRERGPRRIVVLLAVASIVVGAVDAATVIVAIDALGRDEGVAGIFGTLSGVGGFLGAAAGVLLVGRRRLAPVLIGSGLVSVAPFLGLALPVSVVSAAVIFLVCGFGMTLVELSGQTLLQGVTPDDLMARVFGALEGLTMAGIAVGSLAVSIAIHEFDVAWGAVLFAGGVALLVLVSAAGVLAIDRDRPPVDAELLALVRRVPLFSPLPAYSVEQLLQSFERVEVAPGDVVMSQGEVGDAVYLIASGDLDVSASGQHLQMRTAGEYIGEVALLYDRPRTATVMAASRAVLYRLGRVPFLEAITGHPRSEMRAESLAQRRLATLPDDA